MAFVFSQLHSTVRAKRNTHAATPAVWDANYPAFALNPPLETNIEFAIQCASVEAFTACLEVLGGLPRSGDARSAVCVNLFFHYTFR